MPEGETGQLLVRGPAVFDGYWRQPEATAAAFADGWFRTGDLGERAADGYVTLRGRASDLIISGGFNVYPREIEDVLLEQPGVREAAVLGVPDARRGELPLACFAGEADPAALEAACRRLLASFKVPRSFVRVDALPRNAMGKVDKGRLREALAKGRAGGQGSRVSSYRRGFGVASTERCFCADSSRAASMSAVAWSDGSLAPSTRMSRRRRCASWPLPTDHLTA